MTNFKSTSLSIYSPSKDGKFNRFYGHESVRGSIELSEAFLVEYEGKGWVLHGFLEGADPLKKGKDYTGELSKIPVVLQIEKEGDKASASNNFLCEQIKARIGLGKENPFMLTTIFNHFDETALQRLSAPDTIPEVVSALSETGIPVLKKLDALDKIKDLPEVAFYQKGNSNNYGSGSKSLSPSDKWESIKPLLGVEGENLSAIATNIAAKDAKTKDVLLALITAICS